MEQACNKCQLQLLSAAARPMRHRTTWLQHGESVFPTDPDLYLGLHVAEKQWYWFRQNARCHHVITQYIHDVGYSTSVGNWVIL